MKSETKIQAKDETK